MSRKRTEVIDDDGNELPPPPPDSPVAHAIYLLEYARQRGFQIGPNLQIGDVIMNVRDLRQMAQMSREEREASPDLHLDSDMAVLLAPER